MHGYRNNMSEPLKDSHECHFALSLLGSVIVYWCLVRLVVMELECYMLLKVLRLIRVVRFDFSLRFPT
jgi:hypothetical protein